MRRLGVQVVVALWALGALTGCVAQETTDSYPLPCISDTLDWTTFNYGAMASSKQALILRSNGLRLLLGKFEPHAVRCDGPDIVIEANVELARMAKYIWRNGRRVEVRVVTKPAE